ERRDHPADDMGRYERAGCIMNQHMARGAGRKPLESRPDRVLTGLSARDGGKEGVLARLATGGECGVTAAAILRPDHHLNEADAAILEECVQGPGQEGAAQKHLILLGNGTSEAGAFAGCDDQLRYGHGTDPTAVSNERRETITLWRK